MSEEDIKERYLFIGYDRRITGQKTAKGRDIIGNKGIGKLAGFGISKKIRVVTVKDKVQSEFELDRDIFDDLKALTEFKIPITSMPVELPDGTKLFLKSFTDKFNPIDENQLREHLFKVLPHAPEFTLNVNGHICSAGDVEGEKIPFESVIEGYGEIHGFYVVANTRQRQPGLIIRVRKRAVTEPSLFDLGNRSHFSFSAEKIIGEVHADFLDPLINTSRDNFMEDAEEVQALRSHLRDFLKTIVDDLERRAEEDRTKKIITKPDVQEKLNNLPPHIRSNARRIIQGVISKYKNVNEQEIDELINWIIRYFESNVLRELMNSIMTADSKDIEKLSELIQNWGLRQLNNVTESIKNQIDIIIKLEELVASDKTLEIDLHNLIEANLWLVREGLELWASDKPLKSLLDNHIDELYKDKKDIRPDIVCRSRDNGERAIILEFKRPKETIRMEHCTQAFEYKSIILAHRPNIRFESFIIGRQYHPSVLASKEDLERAGLFLWSFSEILQRTRARFEEILKILSD